MDWRSNEVYFIWVKKKVVDILPTANPSIPNPKIQIRTPLLFLYHRLVSSPTEMQ